MTIRLCGAALALALCGGPAAAFDVPGRQGHVVDRAGVIAVPTLDGETPEAAAQQVFDAWKMGRRGDDRGLLAGDLVAQGRFAC